MSTIYIRKPARLIKGGSEMSKIWKYHPDQCDLCGSDAEIFTDEDLSEGVGYDGDPMRCPECGAIGHWTVYDDDEAYPNWYD